MADQRTPEEKGEDLLRQWDQAHMGGSARGIIPLGGWLAQLGAIPYVKLVIQNPDGTRHSTRWDAEKGCWIVDERLSDDEETK